MKKRLLMNSVSVLSMAALGCFWEGPAFAQAAESADAVETVSVTGSLITGNGYQAPTPVTALTAADLLQNAPESLPAALEQLPQFAMTNGPNNYGANGGAPGAGNYLNLRGLGAIEGLTMMDGTRLPATSFNGTTDANIIPQAFVSRVDVVTGGASATYGSDAVSGVTNFIINKNFAGLKGSVQGGVSTFDDDAQLKLSIAAGASLFGGHFEASYDHFQQPGIECVRRVAGDCNRPNATGNALTGAGTSAATAYQLSYPVSINNVTYGGLITSAQNSLGKTVPFTYNNMQFTPNGAITTFNPGTPTGTSNYSTNGQGAVLFGTSLTSSVVTDQGYMRYDYDLSPDISVYAALTYEQSKDTFTTTTDGNQVNAFHIFQDNPFLPTAVSQAMAAQKISYFTFSRNEADQPPKTSVQVNGVWIGQVGLKGTLWGFNWSADYNHGDSQLRTDDYGQLNFNNLYPAIDAVRAPDGSIVCRTTLTNPGLKPGCVPWDPFGEGAPSAAAYNYVNGIAKFQTMNRQDDFSVHLSRALFDLPAGTVDLAVGAEYRYQQLKENSNTNPGIRVDQTGFCHAVSATTGAPTGVPVTSAQCDASTLAPNIVSSATTPNLLQYSTTNVGTAYGNESIEQGFFELAVPILHNMSFVEDLDADVAYRFAQYSISGSAQTWKVGANYVPIDELRIRGTMSRDFRAPTLYELFAGTTAGFGNFADSVHTGLSQPIASFSSGNPHLKPEVGNTSTVGVVWTPSYIDGFSASLDYYTIRITNQISTVSAATEDQLCESSGGTDPLCVNIVRPFAFSDHTADNFPLYTITVPYNQQSTSLTGWDLDTTYKLDLSKVFQDAESSLNFRFVGNYKPSVLTYTGIGGRILQGAGAGNSPKIRFNVTADYVDGPLDLGGGVRYIGEDDFTHDPTVFYAYNNNVEAQPVAYFDLNASYRFTAEGHQFTAYGGIKNLLNAFVFVPGTGLPNEFYTTNQALYDVVGRYFTFGIRFNY